MSKVEHLAEGITLYLGDCRDILPTLGKVDVVVTDPPYGITKHEWDTVIPAEEWMCAPAVCFSAEPYSTELINSAPLPFKYDLVWKKNTVSNLLNAKIQPGRTHERILIFGAHVYTPQKRRRTPEEMSQLNSSQRTTMEWANHGSVLEFDAVNNRNQDRSEHPSQKPTDLMTWLLRSYTLPGHTVMDPFCGSGSTGVAAVKIQRGFIGIEREPTYFDIACKRISEALKQPDMFIEPLPPTKQEAFEL